MNALCPECGRAPLYRWDCIRCAQMFRRPHRDWERKLAEIWAKSTVPVSPGLILAGEIRRLQSLGRTAAQAASELGLTVDRLNRIRSEAGIAIFAQPLCVRGRPASWTREQNAALASAIRAGVSKKQFAVETGRTVHAVEKRRRLLKLPAFARPISDDGSRKRLAWPPARIQALKQLRAERFSFAECAARMNTSRGAIARSVQKYLKEDVNP